MLASLTLLAVLLTHESGARAWTHVPKAIAKEIQWGPADQDRTQRMLRALSNYACGMKVNPDQVLLALDLPDSLFLNPERAALMRVSLVDSKSGVVERIYLQVLCRLGPPYVDEGPQKSFLLSVPRSARIDSIEVKISNAQTVILTNRKGTP